MHADTPKHPTPKDPDQDDLADKTRDNEASPGGPRDPEADGMEFPDGAGRKHGGDLGTGS